MRSVRSQARGSSTTTLAAVTAARRCYRDSMIDQARAMLDSEADQYRAGASVRAIAASAGRSYTGQRERLIKAGVQLRPRGGSYRAELEQASERA